MIAEMAGMPPDNFRDSVGAQWTYFPSAISGSNVPECSNWIPTMFALLKMQLFTNRESFIHTTKHFVSVLCPTNAALPFAALSFS